MLKYCMANVNKNKHRLNWCQWVQSVTVNTFHKPFLPPQSAYSTLDCDCFSDFFCSSFFLLLFIILVATSKCTLSPIVTPTDIKPTNSDDDEIHVSEWAESLQNATPTDSGKAKVDSSCIVIMQRISLLVDVCTDIMERRCCIDGLVVQPPHLQQHTRRHLSGPCT